LTEITERFETQSGTTFTKEETEAGNVRYRKNGTFTSSQSFAAGKSHTPTAEVRRGNTDPSDIDRTDLNKPFDATSYIPTEAFDDDSFEREQAAEANRFYGFLQAEETPDDRVEAALEYQDMVRELDDSNSPEEDREIKERYGVGGS
jgi:hypothetical protein